MGKYINIGNAEFESVRKDEYVDKSMLIAYVNKVLGTQRKFLCVTRARRFGKSIAAKMLNAYYDESVNSHALFHDLNIAKDPSCEQHLNKYPVIYLDASGFTSELTSDRQRVVHELSAALGQELMETYPEVGLSETEKLPNKLLKVVEHTQKQFIMIVDEWDAVLKEYAGMLLDYVDNVLLVGINYDKKTKHHECIIERLSQKVATNVAINSKSGDNYVLSSDQVSDQVVTKYSLSCDQVVALLNALREAIPAALMRQLCGRANATYFRRTTIQPMLDDGIIVPTDLESINSPKQRYYLTPKGIELLKQLNAN